MKTKTYRELSKLKTLQERYDYLKLSGKVGEATFGYDRYLNQRLYNQSKNLRWAETRDKVIIRDNGKDLGCDEYPIRDRIIIHHMNPITKEDILTDDESIYDINQLVCTSPQTHTAIHYSDKSLLPKDPIVRSKNDTTPWK